MGVVGVVRVVRVLIIYMSKGNSTLISMGNNSYRLEMRLNSYPTCDLGLLIRGITLSIGIPYEINVRIDYMYM